MPSPKSPVYIWSVSARSECRQLSLSLWGASLAVFAGPSYQPKLCRSAVPKGLLLILQSKASIVFWNNLLWVIARWPAEAQTWTQTWTQAAWSTSCKDFSTLKSLHKLFEVWILLWSVEDAQIEASIEWPPSPRWHIPVSSPLRNWKKEIS